MAKRKSKRVGSSVEERKTSNKEILKSLVPPYVHTYRDSVMRLLHAHRADQKLIEAFQELPTGVEHFLAPITTKPVTKPASETVLDAASAV